MTGDELMCRVLDAICEAPGARFTAPWGRVLSRLAQVVEEGADVGADAHDYRYTRVAEAVRRLEAEGLLVVERAGWQRAERGNVVTGIHAV